MPTKDQIETVELYLFLKAYPEKKVKICGKNDNLKKTIDSFCNVMDKFKNPNNKQSSIERTKYELNKSLPNLHDILKCDENIANRLLLFFPRFITYIFAISQFKEINIEVLKIKLSNIKFNFWLILNNENLETKHKDYLKNLRIHSNRAN